MPKEQANYRVDAEAKEQAYAVLERIGIKPTDAVNMLMHHIAMFGELPFKPRIPNEETLAVMQDTDAGRNVTHHDSVEDIFNNLGL
jgi:RHH-type rel operon transcriptional repressor/antitoxin RelB